LNTNQEENLTKYARSIDSYVKKEDKTESVNDEKGEKAQPITKIEKRDLFQFVRVWLCCPRCFNIPYIFTKDDHNNPPF